MVQDQPNGAPRFADRKRDGYWVDGGNVRPRNRLASRPGRKSEKIAEPHHEKPAPCRPTESAAGSTGCSCDESLGDIPSAGTPWCCGYCSGLPLPAPPVCAEERLLESIALEELAIAHLINAEAEKAQAVAKRKLPPLTPDELIEFQHSIARVLEMAVEKEKLLLKKLRLLLFKSRHQHGDEDCDCSDSCE